MDRNQRVGCWSWVSAGLQKRGRKSKNVQVTQRSLGLSHIRNGRNTYLSRNWTSWTRSLIRRRSRRFRMFFYWHWLQLPPCSGPWQRREILPHDARTAFLRLFWDRPGVTLFTHLPSNALFHISHVSRPKLRPRPGPSHLPVAASIRIYKHSSKTKIYDLKGNWTTQFFESMLTEFEPERREIMGER
jgi:hypothetical protein